MRNLCDVVLCQWHKREQKICWIANVERYYGVLGPVELTLQNGANTEDCLCLNEVVVLVTGW
jgi:hypothetical protein